MVLLPHDAVTMAADEEEELPDIFAPEPEPALHERDWVAAPLASSRIWLEPTQAVVWGSALHISRWLLAHPESVRGRTVAELGAGTGLPSLCANVSGARSVVGSDYDAAGVAALSRAVAYNGLDGVSALRLDWFDALKPGFTPVHEPVEVLIVADCNYYSRACEALFATVLAHLLPGGTLLLASRDGRASLSEFLQRLDSHGAFSLQQACRTPRKHALQLSLCCPPLRPQRVPRRARAARHFLRGRLGGDRGGRQHGTRRVSRRPQCRTIKRGVRRPLHVDVCASAVGVASLGDRNRTRLSVLAEHSGSQRRTQAVSKGDTGYVINVLPRV